MTWPSAAPLKGVPATTTAGPRLDMWWRATICYRKIDGAWLVTHEDASVPF
jgi:ketosteroid isomerase-like protein